MNELEDMIDTNERKAVTTVAVVSKSAYSGVVVLIVIVVAVLWFKSRR